jgi:hypothetical protein
VKIKGNKLEPLFALLRTNERGGFLTLARCHPGRRRLTRPAGKAAAGLTPSSGGSGQARPLGPHPEDLSSVTNSGSRGGRVPQIRVSPGRIWGPRVWGAIFVRGDRRMGRLRLKSTALAAAVVDVVRRRRRPVPRGAWCRMDLPGPTTSVGTRTDYSVGPWDYSTCAVRHLLA